MRETSVEKRLELIHQIRERQSRDLADLRVREHILYGDLPYDKTAGAGSDAPLGESLSFPLRLAVTTLLLLLCVIWDHTGQSFCSVTMERFCAELAKDYEKDLQDYLQVWANTLLSDWQAP